MTEKEILAAYAAYLDERHVGYSDHQGFTIRIPQKNIESFTGLSIDKDGSCFIDDYLGYLLSDDDDDAEIFCDELREEFPGYFFMSDQYDHRYEIDVDERFPFTTIEDLHDHVVRMAKVVDEGWQIGKEEYGGGFSER